MADTVSLTPFYVRLKTINLWDFRFAYQFLNCCTLDCRSKTNISAVKIFKIEMKIMIFF